MRQLTCMVVLAAASAFAGPVLNDPETFTGGPNGWDNAGPPIGTGDATLDTSGFYMRITFGSQVGLPSYEEDTIYTMEADEIGNFQIDHLFLRFNFLAEDVLPLDSAIYLHQAGEDPDDFWTLAFDQSQTGWTEQTLRFDYSAGWAGPGGAAEYWTALANVDWIGINIARKLDTINQDYGFDNWQYLTYVPEPGVMCLIGTALASLGWTVRRRRALLKA